MNAERSEKLAEVGNAATEFEGEIRELIRGRDVTFLRTPAKSAGDASNLNSLIQRVANTSTGEIDNLIMQLQDMREFLQNEGDRVQQEIADFAKVSQTARNHVDLMADHLAQWRSGIETEVEVPPAAE
jgi:hypothetical protein